MRYNFYYRVAYKLREIKTYLDPGRNIDPLIKTAPDNKTYQQEDNSPVLYNVIKSILNTFKIILQTY